MERGGKALDDAARVVAGLVPAAGASRRMGRDKRRVPTRGRTVLEATVECLRQGGVDPVIVVLEERSPCRDLPGLQDVVLAVNTAPERGMLSSILIGLDAVPPSAAGVAVLPGDHPFVPAAAVQALVRCFIRERPLLLAPRYRGRRGHPLLIARALFDEARACDPGVGLRQLVHHRAAGLVQLDLDYPAETEQDLDLPEDLDRLT
jgi:molybdenum cofactor cytidylyltransferase